MKQANFRKIRVPYVSGWFTTIIPAFFFLGTMALFIYFSITYFNSLEGANERSGWADFGIGIFNLVGSVICGIIVLVPVQLLLIALARLKKVNLVQNGTILKCQGTKLDLSKEHSAFVGAGVTPNDKVLTVINIRQGKRTIHLSLIDMVRETTLKHFDDKLYVGESVLSTEYGNAGYECDPGNPKHTDFMGSLLDILYTQRSINERYSLFDSFPWNKKPAPSVTYIREIDEDQTGPFSSQLEDLKKGVEVSYGKFSVSGDYVIVEGHYESKHSTFLVPLGHSVATIEEVHYIGVTTTSTPLKQKEVCFVHGTDEKGEMIKITVETMPIDTMSPEYLQLDYFFQFMLHMSKKQKRI
jgi:hypothetical protein